MKYDFDTIINRRNTNSHKWDYQDTQLPMWLGDMDFKTAPEIIQELDKRVQHGIFGYALIPDDFFQAYINWWDRRHDFKMEKEELLFSIGVMPSIASIIRELTKENESILLQTPVYNYFFKVIQNNNRKVIENELIYDGIHYSIDFKDLEEKLSDENTTMMILCNPHNPIGKIWNKEELERIAHLCKKHGVFLISDEIHCDLVNPGNYYTPVENTVNEKDHIITCLAPTKTFNIAGIQSSVVHINDKDLYERIQSRLDFEYSSQVNVFTIVATITAFNECEEWANQLNEYIYQNKLIVDEFLKKELPIVKLVPSEATYFLWLDCNEIKIPSKQLNEYINETAGLFMVPGVYFGENGDNFLRLNIACPKDTLLDGLNRLKKAINSLNK
ncbi:MAG: pyridoxal phosphate-dependent aminotransferase [Methanosphaera stadtmanae]|nr:pyridoxal phosphate-dependent aminotransferase [Methanosphaera stadtmanae]